MSSFACMIQDGETGVITGGKFVSFTDNVARYNRTGLVESLPRLNTARDSHGCTSLDIDGKKVSVD